MEDKTIRRAIPLHHGSSTAFAVLSFQLTYFNRHGAFCLHKGA